jgi:hypothetical protein
MEKVTKIIKNDFRDFAYKIEEFAANAKETLVDTGKGIGKGFAYGVLTPFDVRTGLRHLRDTQDDLDIPSSQSLADGMTQGYTFVGNAVLFAALPPEAKVAYLAVAGTTNVAKYLRDVNKRAKEK